MDTTSPATIPNAERRRLAILDAALRVIAADGVEVVTHRRVAAEAGVPLGSTTYYFASRDDLVREAFRHYVAQVFASLTALSHELPKDTVEELVVFLVEIVRREAADPSILLLEHELFLRAARDPLLARDVQSYERGLAGQLAELLERLGVAQPFDAARTLIAVVRGFELENLNRAGTDVTDLRRRLLPVARTLVGNSRGLVASATARRARPRRSTPTIRPTTQRRRVR